MDSYANQFNLKKHIKFAHLVTKVKSVGNGKWSVTVNDLANNNRTETNTFDAVFVCNGHYTLPNMPVFSGMDKFKGKVMHSHDFRNAESFRGKFDIKNTCEMLKSIEIFCYRC